MRRILMMLPVLALMACHADTPTAIDEPILAKVNPPVTAPGPSKERRVILDDGSVNTQYDKLLFIVKNPGEGMPPCVYYGSWWAVWGVRDDGTSWPIIEPEGISESDCSGASSLIWPYYTPDDIPDFARTVSGYTVCVELRKNDAKKIEMVGGFLTPTGGSVYFGGTFRIRCPFLN